MTIDAIKQDLNKKSLVAVNYITTEMHRLLREQMLKYYADYHPKRYRRIYQMITTPTVTDSGHIVGNGAVGQFKIETNLSYPTGTWGMEQVISSAENYLHGGYRVGGGVSVWRDPMHTYPFVEAAGMASAGF